MWPSFRNFGDKPPKLLKPIHGSVVYTLNPPKLENLSLFLEIKLKMKDLCFDDVMKHDVWIGNCYGRAATNRRCGKSMSMCSIR